MTGKVSVRTRFFMLTIIISVFSISSCSVKQKEEREERVLTHDVIEFKDDEFIGYGGFLIACRNGLAGLEEAASFPAFYYVKDAGDGYVLSRFVNRGQGPNDILVPFNMQYLNEDTIGAYDHMNMSYYNVPVPKDNESVNIKRVRFDKRFYRIIKTAYNQYVALSGEDGLFVLLDSDGKTVNTFFEYPYKDGNEKSVGNSIRALAYQGSLVTNPSATKCVYAPFNGDIIRFYDIKKDNLGLINKTEKIFSDYVIENNRVVTKANTRRSFNMKNKISTHTSRSIGRTVNWKILYIFETDIFKIINY